MANAVRVPKYYQLKGELLRLIEGAAVGTLLPTERDLAERFAVSRTTVRQAIAELVVEGRLERTQGSGTYVSEPKLIQLRQLSSFTEDIGDRRSDARSEVLDISRVAADAEIARALERRRRAPRCSGSSGCGSSATSRSPTKSRTWPVPTRGWPPSWPSADRCTSTLAEAYGVDLTDAEDVIETALASPDRGAAAGRRHRSADAADPADRLGADGHPVEHTRSVFRGDRFRFVARHRRR